MRTVIETVDGNWYEALVAIAIQSDLLTMMTWLGGLLFAAAAVLTAQVLSRYVAVRTVEIAASMQASIDDRQRPYSDALDAVGTAAALALVQNKIDKRRVREARQRQKAEREAEKRQAVSPVNSANGRHDS